MELSLVVMAVGASLAAGLATGLGALPLLLVPQVQKPAQHAMLGFAAGAMVAASLLSLLVPAYHHAEVTLDGTMALVAVAASALAGAAILAVIGCYLPDYWPKRQSQTADVAMHRRMWLLVLAVALHNFPEGLAVGVSFGTGEIGRSIGLAIAIGLHNVPEGLVVATALVALKYPRLKAVVIATATGLAEPVGGLLGVLAVTLWEALLPWALGMAAGAMLYVVVGGILPELRPRGNRALAAMGFIGGVAMMTALDIALADV